MADLVDLHKIRQKKGQKRQKRHKKVLTKLDSILFQSNIKTPYDLNYKTRDKFYKTIGKDPDYINGSQGYNGKVSSKYIYRLTTIHKIAKLLKDPRNINSDWTSGISPYGISQTAFNKRFLQEEVTDIKKWIHLRNFAFGSLIYPRNFSFWTSHCFDSDPSKILEESFKVGLTSDWINQLAVIMRCKVKDLVGVTSIYVPTVIDAFDMPIFHPTKDDNSNPPSTGLAINVSKTPFQLQVEEFVVGEIDISKIWILPIKLKQKRSVGIPFRNNFNLWNNLDAYYQTL